MVEEVKDGKQTPVINLLVHKTENMHQEHQHQCNVGNYSIEGPIVERRKDRKHAQATEIYTCDSEPVEHLTNLEQFSLGGGLTLLLDVCYDKLEHKVQLDQMVITAQTNSTATAVAMILDRQSAILAFDRSDKLTLVKDSDI